MLSTEELTWRSLPPHSMTTTSTLQQNHWNNHGAAAVHLKYPWQLLTCSNYKGPQKITSRLSSLWESCRCTMTLDIGTEVMDLRATLRSLYIYICVSPCVTPKTKKDSIILLSQWSIAGDHIEKTLQTGECSCCLSICFRSVSNFQLRIFSLKTISSKVGLYQRKLAALDLQVNHCMLKYMAL